MMALNEQDILFDQLMGKNIISEPGTFDRVENNLAREIGPEARGLLTGNNIRTNDIGIRQKEGTARNDIWKGPRKLPEEEQFFPLSFSVNDGQDKFLLPYEPMINIAGKNQIVKRRVAKMKPEEGRELGGTIKERWSQDDYEITISGALYGPMLKGDVSECFPKEDFEQLKKFFTRPKRIKVECEPLQLLGINYIVIEEFNFPFSKGEDVQAYEIKALSDFKYKLLLDVND